MTLALASLVAVPQPAQAAYSSNEGWSGSVKITAWVRTCNVYVTACSYSGGIYSNKSITQNYYVNIRRVSAFSAVKFWKWGNGVSTSLGTSSRTMKGRKSDLSGTVKPGGINILVFGHTYLTRYSMNLDSGNSW